MNIPNGVIEDPRTLEQKATDYQHVAGSVSINWQPLDLNNIKLTSQRFQDGSSSCVLQSLSSALEKLLGKVISATPYFWRKNYPDPGTYLQDGCDIFLNRYTTTEALSPSQNQSEAQMNTIKPLTTMLGITGYKFPSIKNIDLVAEAIEGYGQCVMTYISNDQEYFYQTNTPVYLGTPTTFGHAICGLAYGLVNGVKTIVCRDSSRPIGITYITESFHSNRNTGVAYFMGAKDVSLPQDNTALKISLAQQIIVLLQKAISLIKK